MSRRLKVLHTMTWLAPGGGVDGNVWLSINGMKEDYQIDLAVGSEIYHNPFESLVGVRTFVCPYLRRKISPWDDMKALIWFYRLVRRERYDVVHTHEAKASLISRIAARAAGCPRVIYGIHGVTFNDPGSAMRRRILIAVERLTTPAAHFLIAVGEQVLSEYRRFGIGIHLPSAVIYSGIDTRRFLETSDSARRSRSALRKELGFTDDSLVIANVGRFSFAKGQRYLIEAFAGLRAEFPSLRLLLIGEGELREDCERFAETLAVKDSIRFHGFEADIPSILPAADLFAFTSLREGLPRSVVEAYLCGLPAVSFEVEGIREVIEDGKTGFVVPSGDVRALEGRMRTLLSDGAVRESFAARGRERAAEKWDYRHMVKKLGDVYSNSEKGEAKQVENFFHSYAGDFDSIYGHTMKRGLFGRFIDRLFRGTMRLRFVETLRNTARPEIASVLDVGCGPGRYCEAFLAQGKKVVGLDLASGMLDLARELTKGRDISFIQADYLAHRFETQFDAACLMGFFDYIEKPGAVLEKLKKDVRKEIYASFPIKGGILGWQREVRYAWRNCPLYLYSREDVDGLMRAAGFSNYEIKDFGRDYFVKVCL